MLNERHHEILRDWRDDLRSGRAFAELRNGHRTRLTDGDVRNIRSDARPYRTIAAQYKISVDYVSSIKFRKARANVPDIAEAAE